jgi:hypothetical protein
MVLSIESILNWILILRLWNNKSKEQILLNLTNQYGVQKYFFIKKLNEIDLCEVMI